MVRITVLYPNKPGAHFDVDYYLAVHMPRSIELLGPALKGVSVEVGKSGGLPDQPAPFFAICSFTCESVDAFMAAFMPHMAELQGDIPNYTDVEAVIQIGELNILL